MILKRLAVIGCLLFVSICATSRNIDEQKINQLAISFLPEAVRTDYEAQNSLDELQNPIEQYHYSTDPDEVLVGNFTYLTFQMPDDRAQYLLLAWRGSLDRYFFFRILKSEDGGDTFSIAQDSNKWYGVIGDPPAWRLWLNDLTGDGIPELLMENDSYPGASLDIFQWRNGQFVFICPTENGTGQEQNNYVDSALNSSGGVDIIDIDDDGIPEIVVSREVLNVPDSNPSEEENSFHTEYQSTTKIYEFDGNKYVLWKELPVNDDYPVTVPSLGVVHPGTIPLSELEAQGGNSDKGNGSGGNSDLRIFVSHPAADSTVDDINISEFKYKDTPIKVKMSWPNGKYPDVSVANWEWEGCPVKQTASKSNGEWNPSPNDPWMPSPDGKTEYHFVGPYLELRIPRSVVFPDLLSAAQDYFSENPEKDVYWATIPIDGEMVNGKLLAVDAVVCVKKTGANAKKK